ncbi:MAG: DUF3488 domain-containing protein [Phycisphaeraceae bacterium]|nr:DUF3488 domain-containing protein [Phycisphaeraceae bacterium]
MGLIYLFRRLVFAQVLLGIVAFCMAERNPGMLLVAGALGALSWYVVEGPTGKPLPQWIVIPGAMAAVGWLLLDLYWQHGHVILAMGHFTMWLQILLLYAKKTNREYGEILVLSLMQMIGASVLTLSMIFGMLLIAYCVLALFTLLLFQLKITSDLVLEANREAAPPGVELPRPKAVVCRGHRWHFRITAATVGMACAFVAVLVFLALPRSNESGIPASMASPLGIGRQAGFSPQVSLDGPPINSGGREPVLYAYIRENGKPVRDANRGFLLRGAALDQYNVSTHTWTRGATSAGQYDIDVPFSEKGLELADVAAKDVTFAADIALRSSEHRNLFTFSEHPASHFHSANLRLAVFNPVDQQISAKEAFTGVVRYSIRGVSEPTKPLFDTYCRKIAEQSSGATRAAGVQTADRRNYAVGWHDAHQRQQFRRKVDEILKEAGIQLKPRGAGDPSRLAAAQAIAEHLRKQYTYELTNPAAASDQEPIVEFLFRTRSGHCELFASAMAALARSIDMPARVVTGYLLSEINDIGGYYIARQSHAHAWCEVDTGDGVWIPLDATPPDSVAAEHATQHSWLSLARELYEHCEFLWVSTVVSYNADSRDQLVSNVQSQIRDAANDDNSRLRDFIDWIRSLPDQIYFDKVTYTIMGGIVFFIVVGMASLIHTIITRNRRLTALQLTRLPRRQRKDLTRRLRWYLHMLDMLERNGYVRPMWQSPLDFSRELAEANPLRFDPVVSLTEIFYEIRFGHRELDEDRSKRVEAHLTQLQHALVRRPT